MVVTNTSLVFASHWLKLLGRLAAGDTLLPAVFHVRAVGVHFGRLHLAEPRSACMPGERYRRRSGSSWLCAFV